MLSRLSFRTQKKIVLVGFIAIPLLLLLTFAYYPALELIRLSFMKWNGVSANKEWIGLTNYKEVFTNPELFGVFKHNFAYFAVGIVHSGESSWYHRQP